MMPETQTKPVTKPKAKAEPTEQDLAALRCEAAAAALEEACLANANYLESGEMQAPARLYDGLEDLVEIVAEGPQIAWPQKSWEFLESIVSIAGIVDEDKSNWRSNSRQHHRRLQFFLQKAVDQVVNLLDTTPPEPIVCDLETIEECVEQKLTDDQIAKLYGWYTPAGQLDRKRVKAAKAGDVTPPATVTHAANVGGPERQPHLGDLDSCLSLFANQ